MFGIQRAEGTTRWVFLTKKYAIKIPSLSSWRSFLDGLLANMRERQLSPLCPKYFLPVLSASRFGLYVVMPRVKTTKQATWYLHAFMADLFHADNDDHDQALTARRYCEYIASNVALYKGIPVCIDYGTYTPSIATEAELDSEMYYLKLRTRDLVEKLEGRVNAVDPQNVIVPGK